MNAMGNQLNTCSTVSAKKISGDVQPNAFGGVRRTRPDALTLTRLRASVMRAASSLASSCACCSRGRCHSSSYNRSSQSHMGIPPTHNQRGKFLCKG